MVKELILERNGQTQKIGKNETITLSLILELFPHIDSQEITHYLAVRNLNSLTKIPFEMLEELLLSTNHPLDNKPKIRYDRNDSEVKFYVRSGTLTVRENI